MAAEASRGERVTKLDVERRGNAVIMTPHGGLIGGDLTEQMENVIEEELLNAPRCLVVDMENVGHINSIGMAAVIRAHAQSRQKGTIFSLCNPRPRIRAAFEVTRLTTLGILRDTLEESLKDCD